MPTVIARPGCLHSAVNQLSPDTTVTAVEVGSSDFEDHSEVCIPIRRTPLPKLAHIPGASAKCASVAGMGQVSLGAIGPFSQYRP